MTWVRRTPDPHNCTPPMREVVYQPPRMSAEPPPQPDPWNSPGVTVERPDGYVGDLWRCECGRLWHIWVVLDFSLAWLPAMWWQRVRYWRHQ
jgi:hypothetical protein